MRWISAAISDRGLVRDRNEDAFLRLEDAGVFAVADGMGGHPAGDVASRVAVDEVRSAIPAGLRDAGWAAESVRNANRAILDRASREHAESGMGTTLSVLSIEPAGTVSIAHVGDTRVYLWRDGALRRLTRDATALQDAIEAGEVDPSRETGHPLGSMLTRVLGLDADVDPDEHTLDAAPGDLFLLCSDGICGVLDDAAIAEVLRGHPDPGEALAELVDRVTERGAPDNATGISVLVVTGDDAG